MFCRSLFIFLSFFPLVNVLSAFLWFGGCRGHDRMVVGFTTTCTISAYHHKFESSSGKAYLIQHCDKGCQWLATGRWFSPGPPVSSTNKTDRHNITEILLKEVLNTINHSLIYGFWLLLCYLQTFLALDFLIPDRFGLISHLNWFLLFHNIAIIRHFGFQEFRGFKVFYNRRYFLNFRRYLKN